MKRIFYPFAFLSKSLVTLFLTAFLMCGVTSKAQISFFDFSTEFPVGGDETFDNLGVALELGVKFQVDHTGIINGIHYYKNASNTGTHFANLWLNNGTNLATADDGGDPGVGWRYIPFATAIAVTPGITYVASVFMPTGFYSATAFYFSGGLDITRSPIIALATANPAGAPGNGVYIESPTSAFPNLTNQAPNYWVDVDFTNTFPLPVSLSDLKAITTNRDVTVSWKTASETNNRGFEIQRSNNGADWYAVSFVNGASESTIARNYSYTDKGLAPGLYYYRLKQVDNDGKFKNSAIVTATVSGKGAVSLYQNYPNPFRNETAIRFDLPVKQKVRLSIVDITGREVKVLADRQSEAGSHLVNFDATGLSRQLYIIRLQTEKGILTRKIIIN